MTQYMNSLDLLTPVQFGALKGYICAKCYSPQKQENEYDIRVVTQDGKWKVEKYLSDRDFKLLEQEAA
jgi:hypothetical protein